MKFKIILGALLFTFMVNAQNKLYYIDLQGSTKPSGPFNEYITQDGVIFQVGDTITIGYPEGGGGTFNYIKLTDGMFTTLSAEEESSGYKTQIASFVIKKKNGKFYAMIKTSGKMLSLSAPIYYTVEIEDAVRTGELKTGFFISSEEAIKTLKAAKDKLDLGLITQEEYDKKKEELVVFIK